GRNGQSFGTLTSHSYSGAFAAVQSRPARMPARGPAKSGTLSATTGRQVSAKRAGSPLALMTMRLHCGASRPSTRSRMVTPPMRMRALSPPPMRRARPPARTRPRVGGNSATTNVHDRHSGAPRSGEPGIHNRRRWIWIPGSLAPLGPRDDGIELLIMHRGLAPVLGAFFLDKSEVLIEHDAVLAGSATKRLPRARPTRVKFALRAN